MTGGAGLHVVTGGPGSGKSALITTLAAVGVAHGEEAGRAVIRAERDAGGDALPWADRAAFAERMLAMDIATYRAAAAMRRPVILDRGIPDTIGYLRLCGLPVPDHVHEAFRHHPYDRTVFLAPHWSAIYATDAERRQDEDEARRTHAMMADVYAGLGYDLVPLPLASMEERVSFVLARI